MALKDALGSWAAATCVLLLAGACAGQDVPGISGFFERHALGLPPTPPLFTLAFPLHFVRRALWDTGYVLTAPGRWDRSDWTRFSLFAAGTGGVMALDREIDVQSRIDHPRSGSERDFENGLQNLGDLPGIAAVVGASYLFGLVTGDDKFVGMGTDIAEALVVSSLFFTGTLENAVGRRRPRAGKGTFHLAPFTGGVSFPSGHTTAAFALAAGVAEHADNNLWVAVPAYVLAAGVGVARVRANAHFASDVFVGAAIGALTARNVVRLERRRMAGAGGGSRASVEVAPLLGAEVRGVQVTLHF